ncbi:hypothetical protein LINPERHAP1_LOCUS16441 [Linum perenne]
MSIPSPRDSSCSEQLHSASSLYPQLKP